MGFQNSKMRVALFLFVALAFVAASVSAAGQDDDDAKDFADWIALHGRNYTSQAEHLRRQLIFTKNKLKQAAHNIKYKAGLKSWKEDLTKFTDMTVEEFLKSLGYDNSTSTQNFGTALTVDEAYGTNSKRFGEIDWRARGKVSAVKNQGSCGSCWTFAASAVVETCVAISTNSANLLDLAEQNYMDCLFSKTCQKGGLPSGALEYAKNHGQGIEGEYPYVMRTGSCHDTANRAFIGNRVAGRTEADLERMLQNGVVSVSLDATVLQNYRGGVINSRTPNGINHAVTVVALTSKCDGASAQCWVIKNSWGSRWGEGGYFRVVKGINAMGIAQVLDSATNCRYNGQQNNGGNDSNKLGHIEQGDRGGADYATTTASSSADCRAKCGADNRCAVWAFEACAGGSKCWLKTNRAFDLAPKQCRTSGVIPGRG